ncbi:MAG: DUF998 domain-containing protein [Thermoplasmataceae archaeon]
MAENKMEMRIAGLILFIAVAQFVIFLNIAAFLDPGYIIHVNTISHLGVPSLNPYWYVFSATIISLGSLIIVGGIILRKYSPMLMIFLVLSGFGSIGVGLVNETFGTPHLIFALFAFLFSSLSSYAVFMKKKDLISTIWAILGTIGLVALILFMAKIHLGMGVGGMERLIVIPNLIWSMGFSTYLIGKSE